MSHEEAVRDAIVKYRISCDYRWTDLKNGYMSQEDYEKSINVSLDNLMELINRDTDSQVKEAERFNYELGYRTAVTDLTQKFQAIKQEAYADIFDTYDYNIIAERVLELLGEYEEKENEC